VEYFKKILGNTKGPPMVGLSEIIWSWVGGFAGTGALAFINFNFLAGTDLLMIVASLGASAVLVYGAVKSPLAQPRNLVGGHLISAVIGVASYKLFHANPWLAAATAVSFSIAAMHLTKTLHPPGGATALIAVIGDKKIHDLGFSYALMPIGAGALVLLIVAVLVNNIPKNRKYPEYWF
jgi:CBS-domain-containing membrane protein